MPVALYMLAVAVFAQATSEFMLAGLVPEIAAELAISTAAAGSLTSAFAVGMIVGAPGMAVLCRRFPPRAALLAFLTVFVAVHVVGALTPSFTVLFATRVISALANAGFLAVALAVAVRMVPGERTGRATALLLAGTTLACVAGVPAGALLGQAWGWRSAFWAVALISLPAIIGVVLGVPATAGRHRVGGVVGELGALRRPNLALTLLVGALVNGATFCTFTYLAPVLTDRSGLDPGWVPIGLALFGIGSFVGVTAAGRLADRHAGIVILVGGVMLVLGWTTFALTAVHPTVALIAIGVQGALSFAVGSTVIARALVLAVDAPTLGGSYATASFNVGAAIGPALGGLALDATQSAQAPIWISAALGAAGLVTAACTASSNRRDSAVAARSL
ncbi:Cmx/CmrA family chloramphenicol efflux MFS transporter [Pseudonocardia alaniniphila]|uniref:MFS transporter n=1 Tax=Pseudonocardia alaniniphila TaxID=75291 RepID=A0ABS9TMK9_9PSEU|nr:Cmx/CmrA family chloramphenicol efflux MFS transporter [Pseudonocardia alaniniphila]MCH6169775.1 MFS transporter [Pseudonocardia alaniniphila]